MRTKHSQRLRRCTECSHEKAAGRGCSQRLLAITAPCLALLCRAKPRLAEPQAAHRLTALRSREGCGVIPTKRTLDSELSVFRCPAAILPHLKSLAISLRRKANCRKNARITDSRFSVDWFRYGGNRPEAEKRMSTRRARPIRPGRAYPCRSWGSPRAVSITLQPTSGGARFNRASNILQRGNILPNPLRPRHRCRPPLAIEIIGAGAAATSEILADLPKVSGHPLYAPFSGKPPASKSLEETGQ